MQNGLRTLVIKFKNGLQPYETPLWRGAVIAAVGAEGHELFHNHEGDSFRYRYPLIQYKRINRQAAIVCVGEGVDEIGSFFSQSNFDIRIGDRQEHLEIDSVTPHRTVVQLWHDEFEYYLRGWLPFNQENYRKYTVADDMRQRLTLIESILTGNMLSFCKSMDCFLPEQLECRLTQTGAERIVRFKNIKTTAMDVVFKTNLSLPDYIGLGKGVSLGHGTVVRKYNDKRYCEHYGEREQD